MIELISLNIITHVISCMLHVANKSMKHSSQSQPPRSLIYPNYYKMHAWIITIIINTITISITLAIAIAIAIVMLWPVASTCSHHINYIHQQTIIIYYHCT
jgi:hypothetical protein